MPDFVGTAGPDTVRGDSAHARYLLLGGDDNYSGSAFSNESVDGGNGNDRLDDADGNDTLFGGAGDDVIHDYFGDDLLDGGDGADTITILFGHNTALGGAGNDIIYGTNEADSIAGGAGNDFIHAYGGDDTIRGGAGRDNITLRVGAYVILLAPGDSPLATTDFVSPAGTAGQPFGADDRLLFDGVTGPLATATATTRDEAAAKAQVLIAGGARFAAIGIVFGNGLGEVDVYVDSAMNGGQPEDCVVLSDARLSSFTPASFGASGLIAVAGSDVRLIVGTSGADTLRDGDGAESVAGQAGDDSILASSGADTIDGGAGFDVVSFFPAVGFQPPENLTVNLGLTTAQAIGGRFGTKVLLNIEGVVTSAGTDSLTGSAGANLLRGGAGNDMITGGGGADSLAGEDGDDRLAGTGTLDGGAGNDRLTGTGTISGGDGSDTLTGEDATTVLQGGAGADLLVAVGGQAFGGDGADTLTALTGPGALLDGGADNDDLRGGAATDTLAGGAGNDTFSGGAGPDRFGGGAGSDRFEIHAGHSGNLAGQTDVIVDFESTDILALGSNISPGTYLEATAPTFDAAFRMAIFALGGGWTNYMAVAVGRNVVVFSDSIGTNQPIDAVMLNDTTLDRISVANLVTLPVETLLVANGLTFSLSGSTGSIIGNMDAVSLTPLLDAVITDASETFVAASNGQVKLTLRGVFTEDAAG